MVDFAVTGGREELLLGEVSPDTGCQEIWQIAPYLETVYITEQAEKDIKRLQEEIELYNTKLTALIPQQEKINSQNERNKDLYLTGDIDKDRYELNDTKSKSKNSGGGGDRMKLNGSGGDGGSKSIIMNVTNNFNGFKTTREIAETIAKEVNSRLSDGKELGIYTYFVDRVLHAVDGNSQNGETIKVLLERNAVSEDLNKKSRADEKVLVKFKSLQRNGQYITHEEGDENGTVQVRNWPYLTKAEIEARAKRIIELQKKKGFDGTVTLFGIPRAYPGIKVELRSLFYKNMEGTFYVDKVVKDFSKGGIRQQLTLGNKAE
jgi:hypothetical protein